MAAEQLNTNYRPLGEELCNGISAVACCSVLNVDVAAGCEDVAGDYSFQFMAQELVDNCAEKDADDIHIGVSLTYDEATGVYRLVVEDNVCYAPDILKQKLANLNRSHSKQEGKNQKRKAEGALGKSMIQNNLERWMGGLVYEGAPDGHIIAVAHWSREGYLNPLPQLHVPVYIQGVNRR